ncbi:adenylate/guanylate cyclase domain-containing protein [Armatimonas sp.]|uniref:adenylate/guanylate cyclase domain-containing protein n=1 Tax=Armatimonas sp. TaxID=1872638 RepID=UPI00286CE139|nr:adenylate/guanylate cyclase domain-containing protein [Armatimonas sp.]
MAFRAFSLRTTITAATLTTLTVTLLVVLVSTYHQWRLTSEELSQQVIARTSQVIERRMSRLLSTAQSASTLAQSFVARHEAKGLDFADFESIGEDFYSVTAALPEVSYLTLGVESTGAYCQLQRLDDGTLRIQHCAPPDKNAITHRFEWLHRPDGSRQKVTDDTRWKYDPRLRPYYKTAVRAQKATWTETYTFVDSKRGDIVGVTYAAPRYDPQKKLICVVSVDFTLEDITRFLRSVRLSETGFGFIVEEKGSASQVIASGSESPEVLKAALSRITRQRPGEALKTAQITVRGADYLISWRRLAEPNAPNWVVCTLTPEKELMGNVDASLRTTIWLVAIGGLIGVGASVWLAWFIAGRLRRITGEMEKTRRLQLEPETALGKGRFLNVSEVLQLGEGLERLKASLRSFERFVPTEYVRELITSGKEAEPGGMRTELTVFFADLAGFTTIAESKAPEEAVAILSEFLELVSREIAVMGGIVDKYNGDEVMAFFHGKDHATRACRAALRSQAAMTGLRRRLKSESLSMRIGLHTGEAILGVVGCAVRYNYTILGDTVNTGKRLEGQNKAYKTKIMLSEATLNQTEDSFLTRSLDFLTVIGKTEALRVFELMDSREGAEPAKQALATQTEQALVAYLQRDFAQAQRLCEATLAAHPDDGPTAVLLARARAFEKDPPPLDWNGVWQATEK